MKLYDSLPKYIDVGGRYYRVHLDFRNVLRMMDTLREDGLMPDAREYLALKCVMRHPGRNVHEKLTAVKKLLFNGGGGTQEKITDFTQDAGMIRAAFMQAYGINLWTAKLHWVEFITLLSFIPEGSRYSEVVGIRAKPLPAANKFNGAERQRLIKAKAACALKKSDDEIEDGLQASLHATTLSLLNLAERGEKHG